MFVAYKLINRVLDTAHMALGMYLSLSRRYEANGFHSICVHVLLPGLYNRDRCSPKELSFNASPSRCRTIPIQLPFLSVTGKQPIFPTTCQTLNVDPQVAFCTLHGLFSRVIWYWSSVGICCDKCRHRTLSTLVRITLPQTIIAITDDRPSQLLCHSHIPTYVPAANWSAGLPH